MERKKDKTKKRKKTQSRTELLQCLRSYDIRSTYVVDKIHIEKYTKPKYKIYAISGILALYISYSPELVA